jgi:hypothetical protein
MNKHIYFNDGSKVAISEKTFKEFIFNIEKDRVLSTTIVNADDYSGNHIIINMRNVNYIK